MNTNDKDASGRHAASPDGANGEQRMTLQTSPSFMSSALWCKLNQGDYLVVLNGQRCFGWVDPVDELVSMLHRKQGEDPSPAIMIIEYLPAQPSQQADALAARLDAIDERLVTVCERIDQVILPLAEQNAALLNKEPAPPFQHAEALDKRLDAIGERLDAVCERIEQVMAPLAQQNGALRNKELDMHVVRPHLELIIQTLNRVDDELKDESNGGVFGVLRDARKADREELRQLLRHHGVSAKYPRRGERFSPSMHEVISRISTDAAERVGQIRRTIHPAYIRERDKQVIQRAWVEVYVTDKQKTSL